MHQMDTFGCSEDVAREEVVANSAAAVLTDEEFVRNLYNNEHSLFEQIHKFFKGTGGHLQAAHPERELEPDAAPTPRTCAIAEQVPGWRRIRLPLVIPLEADVFQKGVLRCNSCNQRRVHTDL